MNYNVNGLSQDQKKKISDGITKYLEIQDLYKKCKNLNNLKAPDCIDFQKKFNGFYKVRRNKNWRKEFYDLFEQNKNNKNISFDDIYDELLKKTGKREKSFVSKLVHTINNDSPIIDQNVLRGLGIKGNNPIAIFNNLETEYKRTLLPDAKAQNFFNDFDTAFPKAKLISDVKKIDFYLWVLFA